MSTSTCAWPIALTLGAALSIGSAQAGSTIGVNGVPGDGAFDVQAVNVLSGEAGECTPGWKSRDVGEAEERSPGIYAFEARIPTEEGCIGPLFGVEEFSVGTLETSIVIGHLDANAAATWSQFPTNVMKVPRGKARVTVYHTMMAGDVDIRLKSGKMTALSAFKIKNGEQTFPQEVKAGRYQLLVSPSKAGSYRSGPTVLKQRLNLKKKEAYALFIVGVLGTPTQDVIQVKTVASE